MLYRLFLSKEKIMNLRSRLVFIYLLWNMKENKRTSMWCISWWSSCKKIKENESTEENENTEEESE
jgi:hypothetical protein